MLKGFIESIILNPLILLATERKSLNSSQLLLSIVSYCNINSYLQKNKIFSLSTTAFLLDSVHNLLPIYIYRLQKDITDVIVVIYDAFYSK